MNTQWTAQWAVAAELARARYDVAFTAGNATPVADLMVRHSDGLQFWVDVKGLRSRNSWMGRAKPPRPRLFYAGDFVGQDRTKPGWPGA